MIKVAINGLGRIGRLSFRRLLDKHKDIEVLAINDLADIETLVHLLKYDSSYGTYDKQIKAGEKEILIDNKKIKVFSEKDPENLPWKDLGIDIVLECTGVFRDSDGSQKHITAGAKKVIISAPAKSDEIPTYLLGINEQDYNSEKDDILSMGSCTTNCLAPVVKVLDEEFGIVKGFMTTVHSYTNDQRILDLPHKDLRRTRAAGINIIPTTTGATKTLEKCLPGLKGKLDGMALRVPIPTVSVVDLVCEIKKDTSQEEVNNILKKASQKQEFQGILSVEDEPLVSSDYKGNSSSSVVDSLSTMVQNNLVKILVWYDNEWGYACRLAEMTEYVGKKL